jgi:nitrate/nitrite-specific signal transduction histidine kinase
VELRLGLRDYLTARDVPTNVAADVLLSLHEAAKNALHACGRPVDVVVCIENGSVSVCVRDHGRGFALKRPAQLPRSLEHARAGSLPDALADGQRGDRLL